MRFCQGGGCHGIFRPQTPGVQARKLIFGGVGQTFEHKTWRRLLRLPAPLEPPTFRIFSNSGAATQSDLATVTGFASPFLVPSVAEAGNARDGEW
jgi:hypothetical protein